MVLPTVIQVSHNNGFLFFWPSLVLFNCFWVFNAVKLIERDTKMCTHMQKDMSTPRLKNAFDIHDERKKCPAAFSCRFRRLCFLCLMFSLLLLEAHKRKRINKAPYIGW